MSERSKQVGNGRGKVILWSGVFACATAVGWGVHEGFKDAAFSAEQTDTVVTEERGRAEIVAVDLDLDAQPMVGFISTIEGRQVSLTGQLTVNVGPANIDLDTGTKTIQNWRGTAETIFELDPEQVEAEYDAGYTDTSKDDRFVIKAPLSAISARVNLLPGESYTDTNGPWDLLNPFSITKDRLDDLQDAIDEVEDLPGGEATTLADRDQALALSVTRIGAMNDVVSECANKLSTEGAVYRAFHKNIAEAAGDEMLKLNDPVFRKLSVAAMQDMKIVVLVGEEVDEPGKRILPDQNLDLTSQYTEVIERLYADSGTYTFTVEQEGEFTCDIAPNVQRELNGGSIAPSAPTGVTNE